MQTRFFSPLGALRFWIARNAAGALMAKATYEPLDDDESSRLDCICEKYPELAAEQDKYISFAKNFQLATEELPFDLSGRIAAALAESSAKRHNWATAYVTVAALVLLVAGISFGYMYFDNTSLMPDKGTIMADSSIAAVLPSPEDHLVQLTRKLNALPAGDEIVQTIASIHQEINANPEIDRRIAGDALNLVADAEFNCLKRYDEALIAYGRLRDDYPDVFNSAPEYSLRCNLLEEARAENYRSLSSLDSARNEADSFLAYQNIVADYPATVLASVAVDEMRSIVKAARKGSKMNEADELELVRERCSNLVARAQMDLLLGHYYNNTADDRECARTCYVRAAASDHVALASQAHLALARME